MNIALLFNADDPKFGYSYGEPIMQAIFKTGILQASGRHMKMSVGDVGMYGRPNYDELAERVYFHPTWALLHEAKLRATFHRATVTAVIFENMTREIAEALHAALAPDSSYLGLQAIDYTHGPHLALYRNLMITKYRLQGYTARIFASMGDQEERDGHEAAALRTWGYTDVDWEDGGAHKSIFDDYDTLEHFQQVHDFREAVTPFLVGGADAAYELVMVLEDLNPQLFNALGSAAAVLQRAAHEEHIAQAALSGRRYIEQLADVLFPPRDEPYNGRDVTKPRYRSRIWAYIFDNLSTDEIRAKAVGKELERVDGEFNAGLHDNVEKDRLLRALADAGTLTVVLLALNPAASRKPYHAYAKRLREFFSDSAEQRDPGDN